MGDTTQNVSQPRQIDVQVQGGRARLSVSPWTIAQHDECFPIVVKLIEGWVASQSASTDGVTLSALLMEYKTEVSELCRLTVRDELMRRDLKWEELFAEDLFTIAQAVWETSLVRPGGGGVLGKAMALLGPSLLKAIAARSGTPSSTASSQDDQSTPSQTENVSEDSQAKPSHSSQGDGEPAQPSFAEL